MQDFHGRLVGFVARRVPDRGGAEDIVQEVMLRVHRHAGELERSPAVSAWVHQPANAIADYYRRAAVRREQPSAIDFDCDESPQSEPVSAEPRSELIDDVGHVTHSEEIDGLRRAGTTQEEARDALVK